MHLDPIVIEIRTEGSVACDYGWHVWTLTPHASGDPIIRRERYVDIWRKNAAGEWKLWIFMNNEDVPMQMPEKYTCENPLLPRLSALLLCCSVLIAHYNNPAVLFLPGAKTRRYCPPPGFLPILYL